MQRPTYNILIFYYVEYMNWQSIAPKSENYFQNDGKLNLVFSQVFSGADTGN
jgi:hypothetical protein